MNDTVVCEEFGTRDACGKCHLELHILNIGMLTRQSMCKVARKFVIVAEVGILLYLPRCVVNCNCEIVSTVHDTASATVSNTITYVRNMFSTWLNVQKRMYIGKDIKDKRNDVDRCDEFLRGIESYTNFQDLLYGLSQLGAESYGKHTRKTLSA